jgi:LmbE family N-acetylglucosaminyl deacetylase
MILMLSAHPDDETLFGFHDLYKKDTVVICFSSGGTPREKEFSACMKFLEVRSHILPLQDSWEDIWNLTNLGIYDKYIKRILQAYEKPGLIVSHDAKGEYGHPQHRRVYAFAKWLSALLIVPHSTFLSRHQPFSPAAAEKREEALLFYPSQAHSVNKFRDWITLVSPLRQII